jgi:hypothetical protein
VKRHSDQKLLASPKKLIKILGALTIFILLFVVPNAALAAGGGKPATKIYNVADTRSMDSGLSKWIADIYNDNLWFYGLTVVVIMAAMGFIFGKTMDKLVSRLGINLGRLEHHE